jgi:hypothetical protein
MTGKTLETVGVSARTAAAWATNTVIGELAGIVVVNAAEAIRWSYLELILATRLLIQNRG